MEEERSQFRVLYRHFLVRMIDPELLPSGGDAKNLLVQFAAMLAAFNLVFTFMSARAYSASTLSRERLLVAAWGDQEFLIATTIAVAGLFALLSWNTMLPERRDGLVLSPLPVRSRTILGAKICAIGSALGLTIVAINVFTGLWYPYAVIPPNTGPLGGLRSAAAYWITMAAAGLFVFCALMAVQGIAAGLLSYGLFLRASGFIQVAAFFLLISVYFLTPPLASPSRLAAPENQVLLQFLPSYWFLGLFQTLNGAANPALQALSGRAVWAVSITCAAGAATYTLAYIRNIRRAVEQPDIAGSDRSRPASRMERHFARAIFRDPLDRAMLLFILRTISRSRQHRLILAAYCGVALAVALAYTKSILYGRSLHPWSRPNVPFLATGMIVLLFAVIGARAVIALPVALPCNWMLRITAVHTAGAYCASIRKSLFTLTAVPLWIASALFYFAIWPWPAALKHLIILVLAGTLLIERSLYKFRKIPFACSYLPGKANLNMRLGAYGIGFLFITDAGVRVELWTMERLDRFLILCGLLLAAVVRSHWRTREFAKHPNNRIQFEDVPEKDVNPLDLRRDGSWSSDEALAQAIES